MQFLSGLLVGFILGIFACVILGALLLLHRPRYVAPTLRRKNRDAPVPYVPPPWEREEGVDYRFINLTGLED